MARAREQVAALALDSAVEVARVELGGQERVAAEEQAVRVVAAEEQAVRLVSAGLALNLQHQVGG